MGSLFGSPSPAPNLVAKRVERGLECRYVIIFLHAPGSSPVPPGGSHHRHRPWSSRPYRKFPQAQSTPVQTPDECNKGRQISHRSDGANESWACFRSGASTAAAIAPQINAGGSVERRQSPIDTQRWHRRWLGYTYPENVISSKANRSSFQ